MPLGLLVPITSVFTGFASITYGDGAAWFTNYDRGTVARVSG